MKVVRESKSEITLEELTPKHIILVKMQSCGIKWGMFFQPDSDYDKWEILCMNESFISCNSWTMTNGLSAELSFNSLLKEVEDKEMHAFTALVDAMKFFAENN